jgi:signal transduction histidine kinase
MKKAPIPKNEKKRLDALKRYKVLDTQPEETFDEITQLAATLTQSKISLVSLIDKDRQWSKSRFGVEATETPRDISFCGHAIMGTDVFEVADSTLNPDFLDNPAVVGEPHIRFYAGAPLVTPDGFKIGTLCVADAKPKSLSSAQKETLKILASHVVGLFESKLRNADHQKMNLLFEKVQALSHVGGWDFDFETQNLTWTSEHYRISEIPENQNSTQLFELYKSRIHPDDLKMLDLFLENAFKKGMDFVFDHRLVLDNGARIKFVQGIARVEKNSEGKPIRLYGTCQDLTEKRAFQEQVNHERLRMVQTSKLASLGEMASGVAHEINNPLTIIAGTVNLLKKYKDNPEKFDAKTEVILKSCDRIGKIVSGLRKFSRGSGSNLRRFESLNTIIEEAISLVNIKAVRVGVSLSFTEKTEGQIECDPVDIEQVFVNILNNAIEAARFLPDKWIKVAGFEEPESWVIQVQDSGSGIPTDIVDKLFEPFFTTRPVGQGQGLGLSIAKGILEDHGAAILLNTNSKNTCFEIRFPKIISKSESQKLSA